jgi:tetratricopeptide (TPR) repeat protein
LVNSENGSVLWADKFDRPPDLSVLRDRIVAAICDSLGSRSGRSSGCASSARTARHRANNDAYRLYLVGKRELNQRGQNLEGSVGHFRQAAAIDTLLAEAWSGLSLALALSPYYQGASPAFVAPEAAASAQRALRLDPSLTEPRIALAVLRGRNLEWEQSEREFKTALSMDPHGVEGRLQYARLLIARSLLPEALSELQKARQDDPASGVVLALLSATWYLSGQFDSALVESDRGKQSDSSNLTLIRFRSLILSAVGRKDEARALVRHMRPGIPLVLYALAVAGDTAAARDGLRALSISDPKPLDETARAFAFLGLGDTTAALDALERATDAKAPWPFVVSTSGMMFESVRRSDRFRALLMRVGLPER